MKTGVMLESRRVERILVVDDEPSVRDVVATYLREEGFSVVEAADGAAALQSAFEQLPDLVILDLNLPELSGVEVFRRLREFSDVAVIMLTSRVDDIDRIVGLELGADDYVGKPFSPREVVARAKSVLRRTRKNGVSARTLTQQIGSLTIDSESHEVRRDGKSVALTPMEFRILEVLAADAGRAFTRDRLLDKIAPDGGVFDRTLDRHVANLRRKIERDPAHPTLIVTIFGVGYKLVAED